MHFLSFLPVFNYQIFLTVALREDLYLEFGLQKVHLWLLALRGQKLGRKLLGVENIQFWDHSQPRKLALSTSVLS